MYLTRDQSCNHDDSKKATWLPLLDADSNREIFMCECGALIDICASKNDSGPVHPMTPNELETAVWFLIARALAKGIKPMGKIRCGDCRDFPTANYCGRINGRPYYDCQLAAQYLAEAYWLVSRNTWACSEFAAAESAKKEQTDEDRELKEVSDVLDS